MSVECTSSPPPSRKKAMCMYAPTYRDSQGRPKQRPCSRCFVLDVARCTFSANDHISLSGSLVQRQRKISMTLEPASPSNHSQNAIKRLRTPLLVVSFISAMDPTRTTMVRSLFVDTIEEERKEGEKVREECLITSVRSMLSVYKLCAFFSCFELSVYIYAYMYTKHTDGLLRSLLSKTERAGKKMTREIQMLITKGRVTTARSDRKKREEQYH